MEGAKSFQARATRVRARPRGGHHHGKGWGPVGPRGGGEDRKSPPLRRVQSSAKHTRKEAMPHGRPFFSFSAALSELRWSGGRGGDAAGSPSGKRRARPHGIAFQSASALAPLERGVRGGPAASQPAAGRGVACPLGARRAGVNARSQIAADLGRGPCLCGTSAQISLDWQPPSWREDRRGVGVGTALARQATASPSRTAPSRAPHWRVAARARPRGAERGDQAEFYQDRTA